MVFFVGVKLQNYHFLLVGVFFGGAVEVARCMLFSILAWALWLRHLSGRFLPSGCTDRLVRR